MGLPPSYLFTRDMVDMSFLHTRLPVHQGYSWQDPTWWHKVSPHLFTCSMEPWLTRPDMMAQGFSTPVYLFIGDMVDETWHNGTRFLHTHLPVQWGHGWQDLTQWCEAFPLPSPQSPHTVCLRQDVSPLPLSCQCGNPDVTRPSCLPPLRRPRPQLPSCPCLQVDQESTITFPSSGPRKVPPHSLQVDQESTITFPASGPGKYHHIPCKWTRKVQSHSLQVDQESTITFPASGPGKYHHIPCKWMRKLSSHPTSPQGSINYSLQVDQGSINYSLQVDRGSNYFLQVDQGSINYSLQVDQGSINYSLQVDQGSINYSLQVDQENIISCPGILCDITGTVWRHCLFGHQMLQNVLSELSYNGQSSPVNVSGKPTVGCIVQQTPPLIFPTGTNQYKSTLTDETHC